MDPVAAASSIASLIAQVRFACEARKRNRRECDDIIRVTHDVADTIYQILEDFSDEQESDSGKREADRSQVENDKRREQLKRPLTRLCDALRQANDVVTGVKFKNGALGVLVSADDVEELRIARVRISEARDNLMAHLLLETRRAAMDSRAGVPKITPDGVRSSDRKVHGLKRFTFEQLKTATRNFSKPLGEGDYASVYKGFIQHCDNEGGFWCAVKRAKQGARDREKMKRECDVIKSVQHPNIVRLLGFCADEVLKGEILLVYQHQNGGSLREALDRDAQSITATVPSPKSSSNSDTQGQILAGSQERQPSAFLDSANDKTAPLTMRDRLSIAVDVAAGLKFLHDGVCPMVVHQNLNPSNILLSYPHSHSPHSRPRGAPEACVSGFGSVRNVFSAGGSTQGSLIKGALAYMDRDTFFADVSSPKHDVFAFGIILLEVLSGRPVYHESKGYLLTWARPLVEAGDMARLLRWTNRAEREGNGLTRRDAEVALRIARLAVDCTQPQESRPSMAEVHAELAAAAAEVAAAERTDADVAGRGPHAENPRAQEADRQREQQRNPLTPRMHVPQVSGGEAGKRTERRGRHLIGKCHSLQYPNSSTTTPGHRFPSPGIQERPPVEKRMTGGKGGGDEARTRVDQMLGLVSPNNNLNNLNSLNPPFRASPGIPATVSAFCTPPAASRLRSCSYHERTLPHSERARPRQAQGLEVTVMSPGSWKVMLSCIYPSENATP